MITFKSELLYSSEEPFRGPLTKAGELDRSVQAADERCKVLVVDDQKLIADSLAEILQLAGFDAIAAYDGWQALEMAPRFRPQWLLSDVLMPRMNGVELAISMRQQHPDVLVLLLSGQAGISEILQEGHRKGYEFELIAKPIHPSRLIERLKEPGA